MLISASIFTSDKPLEYAKYLEKTEVDFLHFDFLEDNELKLDELKLDELKKYKGIKKPLDIHLIYTEIKARDINLLNDLNIESLSVQMEKLKDIEKTIRSIKKFKKDFGFAITPKSDWHILLPYKEIMNHILVMCSTPGISGAKFLCNSYEFIEQIEENFKGIKIYVDGGINYDIYKEISKKDISLTVMGSYLYNNYSNIQSILKELKK